MYNNYYVIYIDTLFYQRTPVVATHCTLSGNVRQNRIGFPVAFAGIPCISREG